MDEIHFSVHDRIHVVLDVFRIGSDDRAVVVVVGILKLIALVRDGRIEDALHAFIDEPLYMSVGQLRRITLGFTGDRFNSQLVDLPRGSGREYDPEAEFCEKCKPERIVLIHVEHTRDSDHAPFCFGLFERSVVEVAVELVVKQVRHLVFRPFFSESPLTAVSGDEFTAAAEMVDGQTAGVCTSPALGHGG